LYLKHIKLLYNFEKEECCVVGIFICFDVYSLKSFGAFQIHFIFYQQHYFKSPQVLSSPK